MSYKNSIYNGVKNFLYDSTKDVQWATSSLYGGAAGAAYGLGSGMVSDNTSVFGGTVGGATFGAGAGAALAYSANKSAGVRQALRDITNSAFGINKAVRGMIDEDLATIDSTIGSAMSTISSKMSEADKEKAVISAFQAARNNSHLSKMFKDGDYANGVVSGRTTLSNGVTVDNSDLAYAYAKNAPGAFKRASETFGDVTKAFFDEAKKNPDKKSIFGDANEDIVNSFDRLK